MTRPARNTAALIAALTVAREPSISRIAARSPLPPGVSFLLEVAAGNQDAVAAARAATGQSEETLRFAAGFYIEQVLFNREADSYRVLGGMQDMQSAELRLQMALLMKWLHPDITVNSEPNSDRDRQVFVSRVTRAWEDIKTDERRAAYDATLASAKWRATAKPRSTREPRRKFNATPGRRAKRKGNPPPRGLLNRLVEIIRGRT